MGISMCTKQSCSGGVISGFPVVTSATLQCLINGHIIIIITVIIVGISQLVAGVFVMSGSLEILHSLEVSMLQ